MRMFHSIGTTAALAEAIGVWVGQGLCYRVQAQRMKRVHGAVVQGGDAEGTELVVLLGDIQSAQGGGFVSAAFEVICGMEFLLTGSPYYIVYTGRFCAPIGCYPSDGQQSGRPRMCQQPLQGIGQAVFANLSCLCNTHLQPPDQLFDGLPVNGVPVGLPVERRIS